MKIKTICLTILLLLVLNYASAAERIENVSYSLSITYNKGELSDSIIHVWVTDSDYDFEQVKLREEYDISEEDCTEMDDYYGRCCLPSEEKRCYVLEMYSNDGMLLYETTAELGLVLAHAAPSDWFDENGNQIYFGDGNTGPSIVDYNVLYVDFPYFQEASTIKVLEQGDEKLEIDLSAFANCEMFSGECKPVLLRHGEEIRGKYDSCPLECPSGLADNYCDGIKDGKYDPDCALDEDPDCIGNEQWCVDELYRLYGATPTPEPSEVTATYSFSGSEMVLEISKPMEGELPPEGKKQVISGMQTILGAIGLEGKSITAEASDGVLRATAIVGDVEFPYTFTPVPEYTTIVKGVSSIEPEPDLFEGGVATYDVAPASITITNTQVEPDWLFFLIIGLIIIIAAFLVKRRIRC